MFLGSHWLAVECYCTVTFIQCYSYIIVNYTLFIHLFSMFQMWEYPCQCTKSSVFNCVGICNSNVSIRCGSRTAATSKMEHFVIKVNGWKPLTIITKSSILDVAAILDPPLSMHDFTINFLRAFLFQQGGGSPTLVQPHNKSTFLCKVTLH